MAPDADLMKKFCSDLLVPCLVDVCEVPPEEARSIGTDILARAEAYSALDKNYADVLVVPFAEETFGHDPVDAPPTLKAATIFVVRNSALEKYHANGQIAETTVRFLTTQGAGPLSHLIAARRRWPLVDAPSLFADLDTRYPRAWAAFSTLVHVLTRGGRGSYRTPSTSAPQLPDGAEIVSTRTVERAGVPGPVAVMDAMEPGLDQMMFDLMLQVQAGTRKRVFLSALSRVSRNVEKQFRIVEFMLGHGCEILTTNYFLRDGEVWVRRGQLVKPDSDNPTPALIVLKGLSGAHRKAVEETGTQFGVRSAVDAGETPV